MKVIKPIDLEAFKTLAWFVRVVSCADFFSEAAYSAAMNNIEFDDKDTQQDKRDLAHIYLRELSESFRKNNLNVVKVFQEFSCDDKIGNILIAIVNQHV